MALIKPQSARSGAARSRRIRRDCNAVEDALGLLEGDPHAGDPLRGRLGGLRSLRVGTYRIIYQLADLYQLADHDQTVRIAAIRHRLIAYRTDPH